jgi:hypothetical protein
MDGQRLIHHDGGRKGCRIVEHHQITGVEEGMEVGKTPVTYASFAGNHQADTVPSQPPRLGRTRSLELFWDREVVEQIRPRPAQGHRHALTFSASNASAV